MNRYAFFSALFLFLISVSAFSQADINQLDENGKRHGIWKKTFDNSKQLRYEGKFDHGKETGEFKYYCETCKDKPMIVRNFTGKDNIAEVKYYTIKGKLVSEGKMEGKARIGEWLYYPEKSANIITREFYKNDKLEGKVTTYYPNGKITEESNYSDGNLNGPNNYYSPEGTLLKKLNYLDGELQGEAFYYDDNGNVLIHGFYKKGKKDALWQYYKNGKVELEETFPKPIFRPKD